MTHWQRAALLAALLAWVTPSRAQPLADIDSGAIAGRVCEDVDGDGRCGDAEPGVAGARVLAETGAFAVTDALGRYHLAGLQSRAPERSLGEQRLWPGRHRVVVDQLSILDSATVMPRGATLEVPVGALVKQDFAVSVAAKAREPIRAAPALPLKGELVGGELKVRLSGQVAAGAAVQVNGVDAQVAADGSYSAWALAKPGSNLIALRVQTSPRQYRYFAQRVEVIARAGSLLLIPRAPEPLAIVTSTPAPDGRVIATVEAQPNVAVAIDRVAVPLDEAGRGQLPVSRSSDVPLVLSVHGASIAGQLPLSEADGVTAVGLLDLELAYQLGSGGGLRLMGRGAGAVRAHKWGFDLNAEIDLRDSDVASLRTGFSGALPSVLTQPRDARVLDRWVDPLRVSPQWADDSATVVTNPGEQRIRVELSRPGLGRVGYGSHRAWFGDTEVGRFHRSITGAYLQVASNPQSFVHGGVSGFYAAPMADPLSGLSRVPGHERFDSTGGSLYYLSSGQVAQGSELVRIEVREQLSQVPVVERHLIRGVDYSIDYVSGRILLARPLSLFEGTGSLGAEPLSSARSVALVIDYERYDLGLSASRVAGGEGSLSVGPVTLSAAAAQDGDASLLRGRAYAGFKGIKLTAEVARSAGRFMGQGFSDDGGLTFRTPDAAVLAQLPNDGWGLTFRATGPMYLGGGFDVAFRRRTAGFSDAQHLDTALFQEISARVTQPIGPVLVGGFFDDRTSNDPRQLYSLATIGQRVAGGGVGYERARWGVRLEARDTQVTADGLTGGRTAAGISGTVTPLDWLTIVAGHKQRLFERGEGLGRYDDSFSTVGVDVRPTEDVTVSARGGWGPMLGPQVWGNASVRRGDEVTYGAQSVDVDGPTRGERRWVTGVRRSAGADAVVFAEDVISHDATALRIGRAVGLSHRAFPGLDVSARYERGVTQQLDLSPAVVRDAGGVGLSWVHRRVRAWARAEARADTGQSSSHWQWLATGGGEIDVLANLRATVMVSFAHTSADQRLVSRLLEGTAAIAWRTEWLMMVLTYGIRRELLPPTRGGFVEQTHHLVTLRPSARLGDRFALGAGGYLAVTDVLGQTGLLVSASLRPSVRVIAGLEVAAEAVRRSAAPDGEGLTALRGELGYRFDDRFFVGAGYTALGFSGNGVEPATNTSRVYLRAEASY